jgi:hypothetical protein
VRVSLRSALLVALVGLAATVVVAADPPYVGTWKLNPARSNFGETTVTYEAMADGQMKVTVAGQSFTFKADGKDYPTPFGNVTAWKTVDASTWEVTNKANAKPTGTATYKLAADGKTLTVDNKNIMASGETTTDSAVYERVSGGPGLAGKWKTKNVKIGSPGTVTLAASGPDGLVLTFVEEKGTCSAKFDGKDHAASGPIWPAGWTCSIARVGTSAFELAWKREGKVMFKDTFTASADGKVLIDVSAAPGSAEKITAVYERQ